MLFGRLQARSTTFSGGISRNLAGSWAVHSASKHTLKRGDEDEESTATTKEDEDEASHMNTS